jgi:predicted metal-dependent peptidase
MKFERVIGKIDPKLITAAENRLSQVFLELATRYTNEHIGTGMGGDPLIFALMYPVQHVATLNIPTAATDGKRYYWNPKFIMKQSRIGLRIICAHEAWHAIYMHPARRGSRIPKLWNIAVDYIVNGTIMEDFKHRKMPPEETFTKHLGRFMRLNDYCELIKNPKAVIKGFEDLKVGDVENNPVVDLPGANEDRELTADEQKELERREKKIKFFYADPDLPEDMKRPERIYDILYKLLPKCPKCGRVGMYPAADKKDKDKKYKGKSPGEKSEEKSKEKSGQSDNKSEQPGSKGQSQKSNGQSPGQATGKGQGEPSGQGQSGQSGKGDKGSCDHCGGGIDIFGLGGTVDDHMDTEETEEKLAKRISDAMDTSAKMAGYVPAALEDELGKLLAPKVTWQDIIRTRLIKARAGNGHNDWTRFRTRPMFSGMLVPKRKNFYAHFGCLLDTSASMTKEDMAFGISQLQSLDERSEGTVVPADATIYWDKATKLKRANKEELSTIKIVGRGGTKYAEFFDQYEEKIGRCDFLIVVTDGFLLDNDVAEMKNPGIDVIWLITSASAFNPPFGRVFDLRA